MSELLQLLGIAGAAAGLLWGCGLLVARPLLPRRYLPLLPLIAPFLGFSLISAVAHYAGAGGLPLRGILWPFVGLAAAGWVLALLDRRLRRLPRSSGPALLVCLLAFAFAIGPLLSLGYLTTLGPEIDAVSYAVRSEYLQTAPLTPLPDFEPGKPYLGWVRLQLGLLRAGDVFFVGLLGLLTGTRSHELLTVVPALFFALMVGSVYVLARGALGFRRRAAVLAAVLVAVNNLLLWPVYDNFVSQAVALSFLPVVLAFGIEGARRPDWRRNWRIPAVFAVLFSGLLSVYPAFALIALASVLLVWGLAWLRRPSRRGLGRAVLWFAGALGLAALCNGIAVARTAAELGLVGGALTSGAQNLGGNIVVFPSPVEALGLISHAAASHGSRWERVPEPVLNALGVLFASVAAFGWWRLRPRARLAAAALLAVSALLMAQQRWIVPFPYGYFKAITTAAPHVLMLVAAGLAALWRARGIPRWLAAGAAALLLAVNLKHGLWTQSLVLDHMVLLDRELIDIGRAASAVEPDAWVLLDMKEGLRQHWLGYLIRDRRIRFLHPLWFGNIDDPAASDAFFRYAVVEREIDGLTSRIRSGDPWYDPATYVSRGGTSRYELRERRDALLGSVQWERRWPERTGLVVALGSSLSLQLGPEVQEGGLNQGSRPRTVQLRLYNLGSPGPFEVGASPLSLGPGGWLLDLDLECVPGNRLAVGRSSGDVLLADVRVLRTATGAPGACLETSPLSTGAAYVEQDDLGKGRIRFRTALLRPEGDDQLPYRLGLKVFELSEGKLFGVWSLDFPLAPRVQHGTLEIDLRDRSTRGTLDGRPAKIEITNTEQETGSFEAQAVWWQFNPVERLRLQRMLWFQRWQDGTVQVIKTIPAGRIQVLGD